MNVVVGRGHGTGARKPAHEAPVNAGMGQVRRGPGTVPLLLAGLPRGVPVPVSPLPSQSAGAVCLRGLSANWMPSSIHIIKNNLWIDKRYH
jgi:hypothetical protein